MNEPINKINSYNLGYIDYYEKNVEPDGNCYFHCLSYYYRNTEDYYSEFRELIYELFSANIKKYVNYLPDYKEFNIPEQNTEKDIINILKLYAENIKKDKNWAGDYEIQTTSYYLNININIVYKDLNEYKNYSYYKAPSKTEDTINLLYVSNNHFILLYKRNINNGPSIIMIII